MTCRVYEKNEFTMCSSNISSAATLEPKHMRGPGLSLARINAVTLKEQCIQGFQALTLSIFSKVTAAPDVELFTLSACDAQKVRPLSCFSCVCFCISSS